MKTSVPIIQLDYFTGEYIDRYESESDAARDNSVKPSNLSTYSRIKKRMKGLELFFIREKDYNPEEDYSLRLKISNTLVEKIGRLKTEKYTVTGKSANYYEVTFENGDVEKYFKWAFLADV